MGAELMDGSVIRGQNDISHPSSPCSPCSKQVDKSRDFDTLSSPIKRVFYLSSEGTGQEHEVSPHPNPRVLTELQQADSIVYGMGSLYTSICPALCLQGVGEAIAARRVPKILLLNGSHDRETSTAPYHVGPMTAADVVQAVCDALNRKYNIRSERLDMPTSSYVNAILVPKNGPILVNTLELQKLGVQHIVQVDSTLDSEGRCLFDSAALVNAISCVLQSSEQAAAVPATTLN